MIAALNPAERSDHEIFPTPPGLDQADPVASRHR
jgi:hypothetical protein